MGFFDRVGDAIARPFRETGRYLRNDPIGGVVNIISGPVAATLAGGGSFLDNLAFGTGGPAGTTAVSLIKEELNRGMDAPYLPGADGELDAQAQDAYDKQIRKQMEAVRYMQSMNRTGGIRNGIMRNPFNMRMMDMSRVTPPSIKNNSTGGQMGQAPGGFPIKPDGGGYDVNRPLYER